MTVHVPFTRARVTASARASCASHGPGRRWPSHVTAAEKLGDDAGVTGLLHRAFFQLGEVGREQLQTVGVVPEEIALDEYGRDGIWALAASRPDRSSRSRKSHEG